MELSLYIKRFGLLLLATIVLSCGDKEDPTSGDNFDRAAMLEFWTDQQIIPAYTSFHEDLSNFNSKVTAFQNEISLEGLSDLRSSFSSLYIAWQSIAHLNIGKAESETFRDFINTYPSDVTFIEEVVENDMSVNLSLISTKSVQGFPALDYLLFGLGESSEAVFTSYEDAQKGARYLSYLVQVSRRMLDLNQLVLDDWEGDFKVSFKANSGNSATSSIDKLINDYIFYFERNLRAGKVGIPAGQFSDTPLPDHVESLYHKGLNKELLLASIDAVQDFFNGVVGGNAASEKSMAGYLDYLDEIKGTPKLSTAINAQFELARTQVNSLDSELRDQVIVDNTEMLKTYDELQKLVVLFKIDMLQGMSINVDYIDADGD